MKTLVIGKYCESGIHKIEFNIHGLDGGIHICKMHINICSDFKKLC